MFSPWDYEIKYQESKSAESASQRALFMFANMAANFGLEAANNKYSYIQPGFAAIYADKFKDQIPQLKYLFAIHNQGHGDAIHGAKAVAEGLKKGVPDVCLPLVARQQFMNGGVYPINSGLYIELKRKPILKPGQRKAEVVHRSSGKASSQQEDWQAFLRQQGYVCEICYGFEEAKDLILRYLKEGGLI